MEGTRAVTTLGQLARLDVACSNCCHQPRGGRYRGSVVGLVTQCLVVDYEHGAAALIDMDAPREDRLMVKNFLMALLGGAFAVALWLAP